MVLPVRYHNILVNTFFASFSPFFSLFFAFSSPQFGNSRAIFLVGFEVELASLLVLPVTESESLSDALWMIREQNKLNEQKLAAPVTSPPPKHDVLESHAPALEVHPSC